MHSWVGRQCGWVRDTVRSHWGRLLSDSGPVTVRCIACIRAITMTTAARNPVRWEAGWGLEPSLSCLPVSLRAVGLIGVRQGKFSVRHHLSVMPVCRAHSVT